MTTDDRLDALIDLVKTTLAEIAAQRSQDNAGLRLELNAIHAKQEEQAGLLLKVVDNTLTIMAEQTRLRDNITEQIQLEVQKKLDNLLPFTTLAAAANGTAQR